MSTIRLAATRGVALTIFALSFLVGCVPSFQRVWSVQPVVGYVFRADTEEPLFTASVINTSQPGLRLETNQHGEFHLAAESQIEFRFLMAGSHLSHKTWLVSHPAYATAIAVTGTLVPPLQEQPQTLAIPMFSALADSPPNCPFGEYLLALGQWNLDRGTEKSIRNYSTLVAVIDCEDGKLRKQLQALEQRLWLHQ